MNTREFVETLQTGVVEFNNLNTVIPFDEAVTNKKDNIYFLAGLKEKLNKRASDKNIGFKKYFCVDVDMRNQFDDEVTNEDIISEGMNMAAYLHEEDELLGQWRHIVFSGNGLHIYYTFEPKQFDKEVYAEGVQRFFENWDEFWGDKTYYSDKACKNIGRILRLPGSINQKNGAEVKIIASQNVDTTFDIEKIGKQIIKEQKKEREERARQQAEEYEKMRKMDAIINRESYKDNTEANAKFFAKVDQIPAYMVSMKLLPQFPFLEKTNRNFLSDEPKKGNRFTAFYYSESKNCIYNGGSSHYNYGDVNSGYSNGVLVKHFFDCDWKTVAKWFKDNFNIK